MKLFPIHPSYHRLRFTILFSFYFYSFFFALASWFSLFVHCLAITNAIQSWARAHTRTRDVAMVCACVSFSYGFAPLSSGYFFIFTWISTYYYCYCCRHRFLCSSILTPVVLLAHNSIPPIDCVYQWLHKTFSLHFFFVFRLSLDGRARCHCWWEGNKATLTRSNSHSHRFIIWLSAPFVLCMPNRHMFSAVSPRIVWCLQRHGENLRSAHIKYSLAVKLFGLGPQLSCENANMESK